MNLNNFADTFKMCNLSEKKEEKTIALGDIHT